MLVRPGRLALLVIEGDGIRITQQVMPLKRARVKMTTHAAYDRRKDKVLLADALRYCN